MRQIEESANRTSLGGNYAFLCDKVGAGKSLTVLALIQGDRLCATVDKSKCVHPATSLAFKPRGFVYDCARQIRTNLVVVPH